MTLGIVLLQDPREGLFLMSKVPLYPPRERTCPTRMSLSTEGSGNRLWRDWIKLKALPGPPRSFRSSRFQLSPT